jgi:hypothetical protein
MIGAAVAEAAALETETPLVENEGDAIMAASGLPLLSDAAEEEPTAASVGKVTESAEAIASAEEVAGVQVFENEGEAILAESATPELPDPIQVIETPVSAKPPQPTMIESGDSLAPIVPSPVKDARDGAPEVNVNFDDQIVLPPK